MPEALFQTTLPDRGSSYDISADGRFLISTEVPAAVGEPIHLLLNWKPPAK
jgi:hypothetical protein